MRRVDARGVVAVRRINARRNLSAWHGGTLVTAGVVAAVPVVPGRDVLSSVVDLRSLVRNLTLRLAARCRRGDDLARRLDAGCLGATGSLGPALDGLAFRTAVVAAPVALLSGGGRHAQRKRREHRCRENAESGELHIGPPTHQNIKPLASFFMRFSSKIGRLVSSARIYCPF